MQRTTVVRTETKTSCCDREKKKEEAVRYSAEYRPQQQAEEERTKKQKERRRTAYIPSRSVPFGRRRRRHTILRYPLCFACREVAAVVAAGVDNNNLEVGVGRCNDDLEPPLSSLPLPLPLPLKSNRLKTQTRKRKKEIEKKRIGNETGNEIEDNIAVIHN